MSYALILEGLTERFKTVPGLATVLTYQPTTAADATPLLYSFFDRFDRRLQGQLVITTYRIVHRLLIQWSDAEGADTQVIPFIDGIPAAVDADVQLGGRIPRGVAQIVEAAAVFVDISGTRYLAIDFASETVTKEPRS